LNTLDYGGQVCCKFFLARRGENYKLPFPLITFRTSETTVWDMPTSVTEQGGQEIPLGFLWIDFRKELQDTLLNNLDG